jgi:hypothetical protein
MEIYKLLESKTCATCKGNGRITVYTEWAIKDVKVSKVGDKDYLWFNCICNSTLMCDSFIKKSA